MENTANASCPARERSLRTNALSALSVLALSLLIVVILFDIYALKEQEQVSVTARSHSLSIYRSQLENAMSSTVNYLNNSAVTDPDFLSLIYARNKTEAFSASVDIGSRFRALLWNQDTLRIMFSYSQDFDYLHGTYKNSSTSDYPHQDLLIIRQAVVDAAGHTRSSGWSSLALSDRTVWLYTCTFRQTVFAALIDPAWQTHGDIGEEERILFALPDGTAMLSSASPAEGPLPLEGTLRTHEGRWDIISLPLSETEGYILSVSPAVSILERLTVIQKLLLALTLCLLASIPLCWFFLRRWLLDPLRALTDTLQQIQAGNTDAHVPLNSGLREANLIAETVNTMLDIIQQQKIDSYERRLEAQHARLQYLQVQIRPHFFLNCLNIIYSMAENQNYSAIQELVLDLSVYLRSTFRNSANLIPLKEELRSVTSYIRIFQMNSELPPILKVDLSSPELEELPVPPLSILTFVENSLKHCRVTDASPMLRIVCRTLPGTDGGFLNITISDNCGGLPPELLKTLNSREPMTYRDRHVGISNVKWRLQLMHGGKAALTFSNQGGGTCVDMFLPLEPQRQSKEVHPS